MEIDLGFWNANGYYVLPQFFSQAETDAILEEEDHAWASRSHQIIVDNQIHNPHQPRIRSSSGGLSAEQRRERENFDLARRSDVCHHYALEDLVRGMPKAPVKVQDGGYWCARGGRAPTICSREQAGCQPPDAELDRGPHTPRPKVICERHHPIQFDDLSHPDALTSNNHLGLL